MSLLSDPGEVIQTRVGRIRFQVRFEVIQTRGLEFQNHYLNRKCSMKVPNNEHVKKIHKTNTY
jgi:hypothetical protein